MLAGGGRAKGNKGGAYKGAKKGRGSKGMMPSASTAGGGGGGIPRGLLGTLLRAHGMGLTPTPLPYTPGGNTPRGDGEDAVGALPNHLDCFGSMQVRSALSRSQLVVYS
jgi:hypothetical protein